jgi:hypothetical protein
LITQAILDARHAHDLIPDTTLGKLLVHSRLPLA